MSNGFDIVEELLDLCHLALTTGEGIYKELKNATEDNKSRVDKIR